MHVLCFFAFGDIFMQWLFIIIELDSFQEALDEAQFRVLRTLLEIEETRKEDITADYRNR